MTRSRRVPGVPAGAGAARERSIAVVPALTERSSFGQALPAMAGDRLRVALLVYRGKNHVGGQGVYTRRLSKALVELGHHVEVFSGPPYPELDPRVPLTKLPSLELFEEPHPFRMPAPWEYRDLIDVGEVGVMSVAGFPEPWTFSLRAKRALMARLADFDIVHDNQCLGTGLIGMMKAGLPVLGTIHHPITVDRRVELGQATSRWQRLQIRRWYGFTRMQTRVAKQLELIVTVSESSHGDIVRDHGVEPERLRVVQIGVDPEQFRPMPAIARIPGRLITTTSSDVPMKGLVFLLEALAKLRTERPEVTLTIIGRPKQNSSVPAVIDRLGVGDAITFVSGITDDRVNELYAEAELAVVPSLYEGFSLPAVEAMATGTPLIATRGGALPEVVGDDGTTAVLVPPGDAAALATTIGELLDDPARRAAVGDAGRVRVRERYSWERTAEETAALYREVIARSTRVRGHR
jgi:glycosyltransferase involved in cell wall biosynthesis